MLVTGFWMKDVDVVVRSVSSSPAGLGVVEKTQVCHAEGVKDRHPPIFWMQKGS